MTILALDIGHVRTGLAASDPEERIAYPLTVIATKLLIKNTLPLQQIQKDCEADKLLVGLPISLDGNEHSQAAWVRKVAKQLAAALDLPLIFADERLSSREAKMVLHAQGYTEKQMRGKIDMLAASIFLQSYLDSTAQTQVITTEQVNFKH